ncbi:hypothetical protein [Azospirillum argentinense]|nr:hypothetical protein [Azospirillum argentinense]
MTSRDAPICPHNLAFRASCMSRGAPPRLSTRSTGHGRMPYKKVQFVAHLIFTGPDVVIEREFVTSLFGKSVRTTSKQRYLGLDKPEDDIAERVKLVGCAIDAARASTQIDTSDETLKIFMMPEFFFRGKTGAYEMDDVQTLVDKLHALVADAKWKNWLFVFGTIVGKSEQVIGTSLLAQLIAKLFPPDTEAYNYSLIQKGGFGNDKELGQRTAFAVLKEKKSGIDFIRAGTMKDGGIALERVKHLAPSNTTRSESQRRNYDGSSVFTLDGLIFGFEICLDHLVGRLRKSRNLAPIDVQLIPSCGAEVDPLNIAVKPGGLVLHCDGLGWGCDAQAVTLPPVVAVPAEILPVNAVGVRVADIVARGAGDLHVFPALALP